MESGRQELKSGQNTRQTPDSQLADWPPDSPQRHAGNCRASGGLDRPGSSAPGGRIQDRGRAAGAGRAGGISGLDAGGWPAPAAAVALFRCPLLQSAAVAARLASAVPEARAKVGVDADTGEVSRRDVLGGLIHEDHAVQPDESWLPRPPAAWPSGRATCRALLIRAAARVLVAEREPQPALGGVAMPSSAVTASTTTATITSVRTNRRSSHRDPPSTSPMPGPPASPRS